MDDNELNVTAERRQPDPGEYDALLAGIEARAASRKKAQGHKFSEIDFFAGAMAMFEALGWWQKLPARWIFAPMAGRPIIETDMDRLARLLRSLVEAIGTDELAEDTDSEELRDIVSGHIEEAGYAKAVLTEMDL